MRRACLVFAIAIALQVTLNSSASPQGKKTKSALWSDQKDRFGDPLPVGAVARIGTVRYRLSETKGPQTISLSPDGKLLAIHALDEVEIFALPAWKRTRVIHSKQIDKDNPPPLLGLAFSPDSKKLVALDGDRHDIHLFDIASGKSMQKIATDLKDSNGAPQFAFSRDGKTLIGMFRVQMQNGMQSQEVHRWDLAKGKLPGAVTMTPDPDVETIGVVSGDGRWLARMGVDAKVGQAGPGVPSSLEVWDLAAGKLARKFDTTGAFPRLALSADGRWLAASNGVNFLRIYDLSTGKEVHNIRLPRAEIDHLQFSPNGETLYVADPFVISCWDPVKGERLAAFKSPVETIVRRLAFADGMVLAYGFDLDAIHLWDVVNGKLFSPAGLPEGIINDVAFSPDGELFVSSEDGMNAWWNPRSGEKLRDLKISLPRSGVRGLDSIDRLTLRGRVGLVLRISPDGAILTNHDDADGHGFFDAKTGKLLYDIERPGAGRILPAFLHGGKQLAAFDASKIRIWNARTGRDVDSFPVALRRQERVVYLNASPDGKTFAMLTISDDEKRRVLLWDRASAKVVREWTNAAGLEQLVFSPDSQWFGMAGLGDRVLLVHLGAATRDIDLDLGKANIETLKIAFSPDGRSLACAAVIPQPQGEIGRVFIYELASKQLRLEVAGHSSAGIEFLAYAHDSGLLATGSFDTTVLVWKAGLRAFVPSVPVAGGPKDADLDAAFKRLAGIDAEAAFQAMILLAQSPAQTVKHFEKRIAPAKKPDPGTKAIAEWIADLGHKQFGVRARATAMLQKIGASVQPDLRSALATAKDLETKRRIEELLEHIASRLWTQEEIGHARAVEVLETLGTPAVRALLAAWSRGDAGAVLTSQARLALSRLEEPRR